MGNAYRTHKAATAILPTGDAVEANVLSGKTFSNALGVGKTGSMTNNGAVSQTIAPGASYTIPEGYHNGSGTVTASQAAITATLVETLAETASGQLTRDIQVTLTETTNVFAFFCTGVLYGRVHDAQGTGVTSMISFPVNSSGESGCIFSVTGNVGDTVTVTLTSTSSNPSAADSRFAGFIVRFE